MEDEVEQVLSGPLLACHLEITLLQALKVVHAVVSQEVQAELDTFYFLDHEFNDL